MPNLAVLVSNMVPPEQSDDGLLHIAFLCWTADGLQASGDVVADFGATVSQTNAALVAAAKATQTAQNAIVFVSSDKTLLFSGASIN